MQSNTPRTTKQEARLRSVLHSAGFRFRKHLRPVPGSRCEVDVAFPRQRIAVFFDGCFWHGCPEHATFPATNKDWWAAKLAATKERDRRNDDLLRCNGWHVIRVWEHESISDAAARVASLVSAVNGAARR